MQKIRLDYSGGRPCCPGVLRSCSADRKAVKGTLITTSGFTEQARAFAQEVGIELIDMAQLSRLLTEQGIWWVWLLCGIVAAVVMVGVEPANGHRPVRPS
jgi:hypothetical protein